MSRLKPTTKLIPVPDDVLALLQKLKQSSSAKTFAISENAVKTLFSKALKRLADGTVFVITGDIPAMWIRDSTWQVRPLLAAANQSGEVEEILGSVSKRQAKYLLIDPYANAFNPEPNDFNWHKDFTDQSPWVFERKFELDSFAAFWDLALRLNRETGYAEHLDETFWLVSAKLLELLVREQNHNPDEYIFIRPNAPEHDYLANGGRGAAFGLTGLVWSGFRPSDDACEMPFHIPANAHLCVVLGWLAELAVLRGRAEIASLARGLEKDIIAGIQKFGIQSQRYLYEVDGLGNFIDIDDPNVPSLLALPYLDFCSTTDEIYLATREHVLSQKNKMFIQGKFAAGLSSVHTPAGNIWPLALAIQGLTSGSLVEARKSLETLEDLIDEDLHNHESVNVDDPSDYTRSWFSWADMTYFHLALRVAGLA